MNYELAKKLKDAGFPYKNEEHPLFITDGVKLTEDEHSLKETGTEYARIPTLSELIEACGDGFKGLFSPYSDFHNEIKSLTWLAILKMGEMKKADETPGFFMNWDFTSGVTSEEAVANLWLELNKK